MLSSKNILPYSKKKIAIISYFGAQLAQLGSTPGLIIGVHICKKIVDPMKSMLQDLGIMGGILAVAGLAGAIIPASVMAAKNSKNNNTKEGVIADFRNHVNGLKAQKQKVEENKIRSLVTEMLESKASVNAQANNIEKII